MKNIQTKPKIYVDFDSPDGNIFTILAHAENAMKEEEEKPSERVQYLIDHVLIPLFNGEKGSFR